MDYGFGAVFGCPAHDQRDLDFANKYNLCDSSNTPIRNLENLKLQMKLILVKVNYLIRIFLMDLNIQKSVLKTIEILEEKKLEKSLLILD